MKLIDLTQGKQAIVDDEDYGFLMQWAWQYDGGYARRSVYLGKVRGKYKRFNLKMHRVVNKTPDGLETDHINGNKLDNRKKNLRSCTRSQNMSSRGQWGKSLFKGVRKLPNCNRWIVRIQVKGKRQYLGTFRSALEAAKAYNVAAKDLQGDFARLNYA